MSEGRYNRTYTYGDVEFYLAEFHPDEDQCRFLILKILEQAMRDFLSLYGSEITAEQTAWQSAEAFLFEDEYYLMWGDLELTTAEFLDLVDLDIKWVREQARKKLQQRKS